MEVVRNYLEKVGGVEKCVIEEEVALKHRLFDILHTELPEVIDKVIYYP